MMDKLIIEITHGNLWYEGLEGVTFDVYKPNRESYIVASDWDNYNGSYRIIRIGDCRTVDAHNQKNETSILRGRIAALEAENERLKNEHSDLTGDEVMALYKALRFYADPVTYFAISFLSDPPCGAFINDFSGVGGWGSRPGKLARETLAKIAASNPDGTGAAFLI